MLPSVTSAPVSMLRTRDHAGEGRAHRLVALQLVEAGEVGLDGRRRCCWPRHGLLERLHVGLLRLRTAPGRCRSPGAKPRLRSNRFSQRSAVTLARLLVGCGPAAARLRPARSACFGLVDGGLRLLDLLIQFGRFDLGQHLVLP